MGRDPAGVPLYILYTLWCTNGQRSCWACSLYSVYSMVHQWAEILLGLLSIFSILYGVPMGRDPAGSPLYIQYTLWCTNGQRSCWASCLYSVYSMVYQWAEILLGLLSIFCIVYGEPMGRDPAGPAPLEPGEQRRGALQRGPGRHRHTHRLPRQGEHMLNQTQIGVKVSNQSILFSKK